MMRIYVDSSPIIYSVEQIAPYADAVNQRLTIPGQIIVSSELALMECLIVPLRNRNPQLVADFELWFRLQVAEMVPFAGTLFRRAAELRAQYQFKTPDALHLAAAVEGGCKVFLTNDARLTRFPDVTVEVV